MEIIVTLLTENTQETEKLKAEINHYISLLNAHMNSNISVNRVERFGQYILFSVLYFSVNRWLSFYSYSYTFHIW